MKTMKKTPGTSEATATTSRDEALAILSELGQVALAEAPIAELRQHVVAVTGHAADLPLDGDELRAQATAVYYASAMYRTDTARVRKVLLGWLSSDQASVIDEMLQRHAADAGAPLTLAAVRLCRIQIAHAMEGQNA